MKIHADTIRAEGFRLGLSSVGVTRANPARHLDAFLRWLSAGMHGSMNYLARPDRIARRKNPREILPNVQSIIVAGLNYFAGAIPDHILANPLRGRISNYAWGCDYHEILGDKLDRLAQFISLLGNDVVTRAFVDTGAILERDHAAESGLGFSGKNTMLIGPQCGSYLFLGVILTNLEVTIEYPPTMPGCGSCSRCLQSCPTGALTSPYILDARHCISYLTVEHKGSIPLNLRPLIGNWIYGCDECQIVCPWQRFSAPTAEEALLPSDLDRQAPLLKEILALTDETFADKFLGTAIYRIRRDRLVRNACVAAGNSIVADFATMLSPLLADESELVRGHAAWALGRLGNAQLILEKALKNETDEGVAIEIQSALNTPARELT